MEILLIVVLFIISLVLSSRINDLKARLKHVEHYLADATKDLARLNTAAPHADERVSEHVPTATPILANTQPHVPPLSVPTSEPGVVESFFAWCSTDWLMKLGGFLVLLGLGWFVSYAFAQNWIGPMGRVALGLSASAAVLALGRYRLGAYVTQGAVLMFVGAAGVVLTLYAAREIYGFFTPASALTIMFLTSSLLGLTAVVTNHKPLAYGNALIVAVAPLLVAGPHPSLTGLFTYLLVAAIGALAVAMRTGWTELVFASLIVVWAYSIPWLIGSGNVADHDTGLLFAYMFTAFFFATSIMAMRQVKAPRVVDVLTAVGSGMFLLSWVLVAAPREWQVLLLTMWTLVFSVGARMAVMRGAPASFFYAYAGVGVALLGTATSIQLSGPALTIAFTLEAAVVALVGQYVTRRADLMPILVVPMMIPIFLSFESMNGYLWQHTILNEHAAVLLTLMAALACIGAYAGDTMRRVTGVDADTLRGVTRVAWIVTGLYVLVFTWLAIHALAQSDDTGTMLTLLVYTLAASYLFVAAKLSGSEWQRATSIGLFMFVVARLLLIEVWNMALAGRVVTFLMIGALLIAVAWLERSTNRSVPAITPDNAHDHVQK
jgi:uncharacterized membrane protein